MHTSDPREIQNISMTNRQGIMLNAGNFLRYSVKIEKQQTLKN